MAPQRQDLVSTIANGTHWEEVRPDNVIAMDMNGNTVEGIDQVERSAFHIHSALLEHFVCPDAKADVGQSRQPALPRKRWSG